jgi:hypothetical protein
MLDTEQFIDTAQNTGKFSHAFTTLTATSSTAGLLTNSGNITTTTTGMTFGTFAQFPIGGTNTLVCETALAFSAQPNANTVIDFGLFQRGASTAFLGLDGVYFRMNSGGLQGIVNNNGVETSTGVFPLALGAGTFAYTNNRVYRFLIQTTNVATSFWIDNLKVGEIPTPAGQDSPCQSRALPWSIRHAIVGGAAGAATQALVKDYRIFLRGPQFADKLSTIGNRVLGSYQGLSGNTMGSLATYPNNSNPTAAAPANGSLTAAGWLCGASGFNASTRARRLLPRQRLCSSRWPLAIRLCHWPLLKPARLLRLRPRPRAVLLWAFSRGLSVLLSAHRLRKARSTSTLRTPQSTSTPASSLPWWVNSLSARLRPRRPSPLCGNPFTAGNNPLTRG